MATGSLAQRRPQSNRAVGWNQDSIVAVAVYDALTALDAGREGYGHRVVGALGSSPLPQPTDAVKQGSAGLRGSADLQVAAWSRPRSHNLLPPKSQWLRDVGVVVVQRRFLVE